MSRDPARLGEVFAAALAEAPGPKRAALIERECQGDLDFVARVSELLAAYDGGGSLLQLPDEDDATSPFVSLAERPGSSIGRYKLLEQIGEGGFGVVFMAEQEQPVRRRVALKIIKLGMDTKQVVARFEAERQALALMDHPNIAKVFDAGATETGRPYFVMELVKGVPITEYCNSARVPANDRLKLVQEICGAIQHAHQKGIIHRDLKPSNVLVTLHDDKPVPKVIDFGVAKATQSRLTERTLFTEFRQLVGTPAYMSPEQAQMSGLDVDTRSDIYSLGVLLYELLTGSTPIEIKHLGNATYDDLRRLICEVDPPSPSAKLSTLTADQLTSLAHQRSCEPRHLSLHLRSDLDWIVMKCLEKDRRRRYESASALAHDVQRYLNGEPVEARPPSKFYRFKKFINRNIVGTFATVAITGTLIVGLAVSTRFFLRERQARLDAELATAREKDMRMVFQATGLIEEAKFLFRNRSFEASENQLANAIPIVTQLSGNHAATVNVRIGALRAQQAKWNESARYYAKAIECCPTSFETWHWYIPVLIQQKDLDTYRQVRHQFFQCFSQTNDPRIAERLVKDCLIIPWEDADLKRLSQIADVALNVEPDHWAFGYFQFAKGLVEYRRNHFQSAVKCMEQTLARLNEDNNRSVQAYMVLAMSRYGLKEHDKAAQVLKMGTEYAEKVLPCEDKLIDFVGWNDWIIAQALLHEATALIGKDSQ